MCGLWLPNWAAECETLPGFVSRVPPDGSVGSRSQGVLPSGLGLPLRILGSFAVTVAPRTVLDEARSLSIPDTLTFLSGGSQLVS